MGLAIVESPRVHPRACGGNFAMSLLAGPSPRAGETRSAQLVLWVHPRACGGNGLPGMRHCPL